MSMQDPISDMLTRIRNAQSSRKSFVEIPFSKAKRNMIYILKKEGFIRNFEIVEKNRWINVLRVYLKYFNKKPVIEKITRVSRPGLRVYQKSKSLSEVMDGLGISIVSTSKGIMTGKEAKRIKLGGEIICKVS
ncbi:30S ribosomal protein S8 [Candidatus Riesia pediculicola]|uniref:Small ribosomal subunit protein uS8 n=1 Tax=Riesia pediculicola (strain USDA) TaxID=515618 RepID=D4G8M0_RIEPU|nr:30S ribosomal protein S8 [Candidatus Riesia pediculicola]ADD79715.1 ribosomal protein S8 [Candidatus Riesia pediculicola USDA]ARC53898.1 30S ribosomal protein S8 [Candidatus Riesia pediculicola]QOJ86530.1 30S ribosomal protein S8 [Candidatus Riesia pediculicola]